MNYRDTTFGTGNPFLQQHPEQCLIKFADESSAPFDAMLEKLPIELFRLILEQVRRVSLLLLHD